MGAKLNLIGQRFGRLTVIESAPNKGRRTQWKCVCDCGNEYIALTDSLRSGKLQSCGCLRTETARKNGMTQLNDLTGQKFGKLTVLEYAGSKYGRSSWKCQCECGNIYIASQHGLTYGETLSCGCLKSSYGEKRINEILLEQNIKFKREYEFSDLISDKGAPLRFDFAIFNSSNELEYLIEYDGEQHFSNKTDKIWTDGLEKRKRRDKLKNQYCLNNNIKLYRIPYWEKNNLTFDLIISDKYLVI